MPFTGSGALKDLFGLGIGFGDIPFDVGADITGQGDQVGRNITFVKANPGDPDYTVFAYGQKYIGARKITVGPGVTVSGRGDAGGGSHFIGAPGLSIGSGAAGGSGGVGNVVGAAGTNSTPAKGGNGGSGGTSGTQLGGSGGTALVNTFHNGYREVQALISGHVITGGNIVLINGGGGGGGGGGHAGGGNGGDGGGGAGVIIMAAPEIDIQGIIDMRGWFGSPGNGTAAGGGGGGGGGGLLILLYGKLTVSGSILLNGGDGGAGFGGGTGGIGGLGGKLWKYSGDPETFTETVGATGATGP